MRRKLASTNLTVRPVFWVLTGLVLAAAAATVYLVNRPFVTPSSSSVHPTVTTSPGVNPAESPSTGTGNPGDQAKSEIGQATATPAPTATPTVAAQYTLTLSDVAFTPQSGGGLRVSNMVAGTSSGQCTLVLTDPASAKRTVSGEILWSGSYAFCSFGSITGVTTTGMWQADLSAKNGSAMSAVSHATFEVKP